MGNGGSKVAASPHFSLLETRWIAEQPILRYRQLRGSLLSADLSGFTALSERLASRGREGSERLTVMVNGCFDALIRSAGHEGGDVLKFGGDALLVWFEGEGHEVRAATAGARMQRAIGAARFSSAGLGMSVGAHTGDFDMFLVGPTGWRELVLAGAPVTTTVDLEAAAGRGEVMVSAELAACLPKGVLGRRRDAGIPLSLSKMTLSRMSAAAAVPATSDEAPVPERIRADVEALAGVGGEHRLATVVFAELDGTDARVAADPEGMAERLDSLLLATHEKADRYRLRFLYTDVIADGVKLICSAGAPISTGEDEEAGLRFATDLVAGDALHRLHIGVNRGRVFAGFLGGQTRHTYTVMGDPVNLSARLMVKAKPGQVVAADDVVRRSRATFRLTPLPPFLVKGMQHPIKAHVVGALTGDRQIQANSAMPIVGRSTELATLHDAITSAGMGDGCVVDIAGDPGIGKSRLVEEAAEDPRLVVRIATECQPYDGLSPYASARTLLRRALGIPIAASGRSAGDQLAATAARLAPETVPLLPLLAVVLGAEMPPTPESAAVAEQFRTTRMHETAAALLTAALPQTTLLVVEDIYYADEASLQLFRALSVEIAQRPWVLVVTRRPDGAGFIDEGQGIRLELSALDDADAARLTEMASGGAGNHPLEQRAVTQRAGGNPLFLLQLVASAQAGESASELPESIERVVATQIDRLDPSDRAVLRQAAVLGRVFHAGVLDALRAADGATALDARHWDALSDMVEPATAGRWRFRHALFRDVAYEGLPFARRRRMHKDVGELLEAGVAGEPDVALLSEHFWLAGDAERTWRYSLAAGDQAWRAYAVSESIAAYKRALGVRRRVRGLPASAVASAAESLGDVLERAAHYEEADSAFTLARRVARESQAGADTARLLRKRATVSERLGNYPRSHRLYRSALDACTEADDSAERAQVELGLAGLSLRLGKPDELTTWAERAIDHARDAGEREAVAYGHLLLVAAATFDVELDAAKHAATALKQFRATGERHLEGKVLNNLGIVQYFGGEWAEAADSYRAAAEAFAASGDVVEESNARNNLAEVLSDQGHVEAASAHFADSLQLWTIAGYAIGVAVATSNLGRARVRSGAFAEGLALLETARTQFSDLGAGTYALDTSARLAEAMVLAGDPERAVELLDELDADPGSSFPAVAVARLRVRGWAMISLGRVEEASALLLRAAQEANAAEIPFEEVLSLRGLELTGDADADRHRSAADALAGRLGIVASPRVPVLA